MKILICKSIYEYKYLKTFVYIDKNAYICKYKNRYI